MTGLEILPLVLGGVGAATSLAGSMQQANAAKEQAATQAAQLRYKADQETRKANEDQAASQRQAITNSKKADTLLSRQQALAASSGAGPSDPTVLNLMGDVAGQGEYNALSALYQGNAQAATLRDQAGIDVWNAGNAIQAGKTASTAALLSGVSGFASNVSKMKFG